MKPAMKRIFWSLALLGSLGMGLPSHASLFDDDEARRAILDLRQRLEVQKGGLEATQGEIRALAQENAQLRISILDLQSLIEKLQQETARLTGSKEDLTRQLSQTQMQIKDQAQAFQARLNKFEPQKVNLEGVDFMAEPAEIREYENALGVFKKADYSAAVQVFSDFNRHYPSSGYTPAVLYGLGTAQYASRDFKGAMVTFKALSTTTPNYPKVPESELLIASCLIELKDNKGARKSLEDLIKSYPQSEAAQIARERLSKLK
jgi:tol-pal system protein YbgF